MQMGYLDKKKQVRRACDMDICIHNPMPAHEGGGVEIVMEN